jgi:hypothetical protein
LPGKIEVVVNQGGKMTIKQSSALVEAPADNRGIIVAEKAKSQKQACRRTDHLKELSVMWRYAGRRFMSPVHDLSINGAFIELEEPPTLGTILQLQFRVVSKIARAQAVVRRSVPGKGMGVELVAIEQEDRAHLPVNWFRSR